MSSELVLSVRRAPLPHVSDAAAFDAELKDVARALEADLARLDVSESWNDSLYTPLNVDVEVVESDHTARRTEMDFAAACRRYLPTRSLLLLGDPGGGKSTCLRHLARQALREISQTGVLPLHVNLRQWSGSARAVDAGFQDGLLAFLRGYHAARVGPRVGAFLDAHLDGLIAAGRVAFLFDSFDEIPVLLDNDDASHPLAALSAQLDALMAMPGSPMILVASRYFRRPRTSPHRFLPVELKPFPDARLHDLFSARAGLSAEQVDTFLGRGGPWLKQARNPFIATLLFEHLARHGGAEPADLAALYEGYVVSRLVAAHGAEKADQIGSAAQRIAEAMLVGADGGLEGSVRTVQARLSDVDVSGAVQALHAVQVMRLSEDGDTFTFVHRRFNEYFLALRWRSTGVVPELSAIVADRKERDALVLYVEVAPEDERRRVLAWCLGFVADALRPGHWDRVAMGDEGRREVVVAQADEEGQTVCEVTIERHEHKIVVRCGTTQTRVVYSSDVETECLVQQEGSVPVGTPLLVTVPPECRWWREVPSSPDELPAVVRGSMDAVPSDPLVPVVRAVRFLDDAFGRHPERVPRRGQSLLISYFDSAVRMDVLSAKLAMDCIGVLPADAAGKRLARALRRWKHAPWVTDAALRAARFLRVVEDEALQQELRGWFDALPEDAFATMLPDLRRATRPGALFEFLAPQLQERVRWERHAHWARLASLLIMPASAVVWLFLSLRRKRLGGAATTDSLNPLARAVLWCSQGWTMFFVVLMALMPVLYWGFRGETDLPWIDRRVMRQADQAATARVVAQIVVPVPTFLKHLRAASEGRTEYARRMVDQWEELKVKPLLPTSNYEPSRAEIDAELAAHSHDVATDRWRYRMVNFDSMARANEALAALRTGDASAAYWNAAYEVHCGFGPAGVVEGDARICSDDLPALQKLKRGGLSQPFLVPVTPNLAFVHVVLLDDHVAPRTAATDDAPFDEADAIKSIQRRKGLAEMKRARSVALEQAGVVPIHPVSPALDVDDSRDGRTPSDFALEYAAAWGVPSIVQSAAVLLRQQDYLAQLGSVDYRMGQIYDYNRTHSEFNWDHRARAHVNSFDPFIVMSVAIIWGLLVMEVSRGARAWGEKADGPPPLHTYYRWVVVGVVAFYFNWHGRPNDSGLGASPMVDVDGVAKEVWAQFWAHFENFAGMLGPQGMGPAFWWAAVAGIALVVGESVAATVVMWRSWDGESPLVRFFLRGFSVLGMGLAAKLWYGTILGGYDLCVTNPILGGGLGDEAVAVGALRPDSPGGMLIRCLIVGGGLGVLQFGWQLAVFGFRGSPRRQAVTSAASVGAGLAQWASRWLWAGPLCVAMFGALASWYSWGCDRVVWGMVCDVLGGLLVSGLVWGAVWILLMCLGGSVMALIWVTERVGKRVARPAADTWTSDDFVTRERISECFSGLGSPAALRFVNALHAHHLEAGTAPQGDWPGGAAPFLDADPASVRLAQLEERWRGLDR